MKGSLYQVGLVFVSLTVAESVCAGPSLDERIFLGGTKDAAWKITEPIHCLSMTLKFSEGTFGVGHFFFAYSQPCSF